MKSLLLFIFFVPLAAIADKAAERLVLSTFKLTGEGSTATCFVVEGKSPQQFLITAHHVLETMSGSQATIVSREPRISGEYIRREIKVAIRKDGNKLWQKHEEQDLAILPLPATVRLNALPLDALAKTESMNQVGVGDRVMLPVFPEQQEANDAGFPILRAGIIASFPLVPIYLHPKFLVDATTWSGDSGGPVAISLPNRNDLPLIIGIIHGKRELNDSRKVSRFVEEKTSYPLDIMVVMQAALVREMIEHASAL